MDSTLFREGQIVWGWPHCVQGDAITQAVDHTPSCLWDAATYEISTALPPCNGAVMGGEDAWHENLTIHRALEIMGIKDGVILNPEVLRFQNRAVRYPHPVMRHA